MALRDAAGGPDGMYRSDLPPSRGQHETIARLALEVLALDVPATRLDATVTIARLRLTNEQNPKGFAVAPVGGF